MEQLSWRQPRLLASKWYSDDASLDVPFVPSPLEIVEQMLTFAKVKKNDLLFDLGCGDGRIVLEAARRGLRAIGVDLDPKRIRECRANSVKAGLTDKAVFVNQDLFETDFSQADVITLYLLSFINIKLRARFLAELRPGTRIVSHDFHMDTWQPDKMLKIGDHTLYQWIVPANFSGVWKWSLPSEMGGKSYIMSLKQSYQNLKALFNTDGSGVRVIKMSINANVLCADLQESFPGGTNKMHINCKLYCDTLVGNLTFNNIKADFKASRDSDTIKSIES